MRLLKNNFNKKKLKNNYILKDMFKYLVFKDKNILFLIDLYLSTSTILFSHIYYCLKYSIKSLFCKFTLAY